MKILAVVREKWKDCRLYSDCNLIEDGLKVNIQGLFYSATGWTLY